VQAQSVRLGVAPPPSHPPSDMAATDLPIATSYGLGGLAAPNLPPCVPPSLITVRRGTGLFTRCPSPAPCGCGLGPPHPQLISMAAEPSGIRWEGFSPSSRYSCQHSLSHALQVAFPRPVTAALARGFSRPCRLNPCGLGSPPRLPIPPQPSLHRICLAKRPTGLEASRPRTYLPASPHRSSRSAAGRDSSPVVHHLRLPAAA
jgi:hypothetical protein